MNEIIEVVEHRKDDKGEWLWFEGFNLNDKPLDPLDQYKVTVEGIEGLCILFGESNLDSINDGHSTMPSKTDSFKLLQVQRNGYVKFFEVKEGMKLEIINYMGRF